MLVAFRAGNGDLFRLAKGTALVRMTMIAVDAHGGSRSMEAVAPRLLTGAVGSSQGVTSLVEQGVAAQARMSVPSIAQGSFFTPGSCVYIVASTSGDFSLKVPP